MKKLAQVKQDKGTVTAYSDGKKLALGEIYQLDCDVVIPAAQPDVITQKNQDQIKAKIIVEGANIPAPFEVEEYLSKKGILIIPDFIANAGGVISSYVEYIGASADEVFPIVEKKIVKNTKLMLDQARAKKISPRAAALEIAKGRIKTAKRMEQYEY